MDKVNVTVITSANSGRMGFTGRNSSPHGVKSVVSSSLKKKGSIDQRNCEYPRVKPTGAVNDSVRSSQIKKMNPTCKTRKKGAISHQLSAEEDVDLDKQLDRDRCLDDRESMWLSSDCLSSSSFFEEHRLSGLFHRAADDWLISWLSTFENSYLYLDKGSTPLPFNGAFSDSVKEKYLAPETTSPETEMEALKDKVSGITMSLNSPGNNAVGSSVTSPDSAESCCERWFEGSPSCDKSHTPPIIDLDSCEQILDAERERFLNLGEDSLLNLDSEDSRWISDTDSEWNLSFDFLSPFYWSISGCEAESSDSGTSSAIETEHGKLNCDLSSGPVLEATNLQDSDEDEPLFWPFGCEHDWRSEEAWKCFSMSPRKSVMKLETPKGTSGVSVGSQFHNSGSTASKILESKHSKHSKSVKKINPKPSRLRDSNKFSMKVVPLEMEDDDIEMKDGKTITSKCFYTDRSFLENDFALNEQLPMESFLGLSEFDGQEGVDSNLYEDVFFLEESL